MKLFLITISCIAILSLCFYISYTANSRESDWETKTFTNTFQCFLYILLLQIVEQSFFEGSPFLYPLAAILPFVIIDRIIAFRTVKKSRT